MKTRSQNLKYLVSFALIALFLYGGLRGVASSSTTPEDLAIETRIIELTNGARAKNGLLPLTRLDYLTTAASGHSEEMSDLGYFAHESPTAGLVTYRDRIMAAGGWDPMMGENIYKVEGAGAEAIADRAIKAWIASPLHYANMMKPEYNSIGLGVFRNGGKWFVTQNFSRQDLVVTAFTAKHSEGELAYNLQAQIREGSHDCAVFIDGKLQEQFQAKADGSFELDGKAAAGATIMVSQRKSETKFSTSLSMPVAAGLVDRSLVVSRTVE